MASGCDAKYEVVITTSNAYKEAGFDGQVFLQLIGSDGATTKKEPLPQKCLLENLAGVAVEAVLKGSNSTGKELEGILRNNFQPGGQAVFELDLLDVGVPEFVRFKLRGSSSDKQWACDNVVVTYKEKKVEFPIYDWIEKEITVAAGKAYAYTQAGEELKDIRSKEIAQAKKRFEWKLKPNNGEIGWGIPRYVDAKTYKGLPKIFRWKTKREDSFMGALLDSLSNTIEESITFILTNSHNFDLNDFKKLYEHIKNIQDPPFIDGKISPSDSHDQGSKFQDPPFIHRWNTDKEFGRQQIMGVSPLALKKFTYWPVGCGITSQMVSDHLGGKSLEEERNKGKIFIGDYSTVFKGVTRNKNKAGNILYCPAAIGLFHADQDGDLVPFAIQLVPGDSETIFTPGDAEDWMLAKMYYRAAASNLHEWYYHFLLTHNVMEPFAVALFRNIPRSHPLYKLLRPHLQTVSEINTDARAVLIGPGTIANQALALLGIDFARSAYKTFHMSDLILPKVLQERGFHDTSAMPKNYFRDDAMKLWSVINKFVGSILKLYYSCDKDVADDVEIQAFAKDAAVEGLGWQDGNTRGMETDITSLEKLVELCTTLIYTSSAGHAAVNFPQFRNYQYIPNSPAGMRLPPHKRGEATMKRILDSLPDLSMSVAQISVTFLLSERATDEIYLGDYPMKLFTDNDAQAVIKTFQDDLERVSNEINKRNETAGDDAYHFLLPWLVPNSIAI